jgi:hypothetical protein
VDKTGIKSSLSGDRGVSDLINFPPSRPRHSMELQIVSLSRHCAVLRCTLLYCLGCSVLYCIQTYCTADSVIRETWYIMFHGSQVYLQLIHMSPVSSSYYENIILLEGKIAPQLEFSEMVFVDTTFVFKRSNFSLEKSRKSLTS